MTLNRIGFFAEMRHAESGDGLLAEAVDGLDEQLVETVASYLESGATLVATGTMVDDVLDPARTRVARLEIATDGEWVWPRDAAYYVRRYRVALPREFVDLAVARGGEAPTLDDEVLMRITKEYRAAATT